MPTAPEQSWSPRLAEQPFRTSIKARWSGEVLTLLDVLDEAGMGGLPAQEFLGDGTGGRLVPGEQENEDAFVLLDGQGPGGQVQVATDGLLFER
jgi:hypothetical protein